MAFRQQTHNIHHTIRVHTATFSTFFANYRIQRLEDISRLGCAVAMTDIEVGRRLRKFIHVTLDQVEDNLKAASLKGSQDIILFRSEKELGQKRPNLSNVHRFR